METIKEADLYTILKRRNGRFAVQDKDGNPINGDLKAVILYKEGLIKNKPKNTLGVKL